MGAALYNAMLSGPMGAQLQQAAAQQQPAPQGQSGGLGGLFGTAQVQQFAQKVAQLQAGAAPPMQQAAPSAPTPYAPPSRPPVNQAAMDYIAQHYFTPQSQQAAPAPQPSSNPTPPTPVSPAGGAAPFNLAQYVAQWRASLPASATAPQASQAVASGASGGSSWQPPQVSAPQGLAPTPTPTPAPAQQPHLARGGMASDSGMGALTGGLGGLIASPVAGRTDRLPMNVKPNSYVIPADVVSGLGQGNTMAGGRILDAMLKHGPYGSAPSVAHGHGNNIPKPPAKASFADGGATGDVPIIVAGGEYHVDPEIVAAMGGGDANRGHELLDKMVISIRKQTIKQLKDLPGPVK